MLNNHEEQFVRSFITPAKRERYLYLLGSAKGRSKLIAGLYHRNDLDERYSSVIPAGQQHVDAIERILKRKGAPDICHVMSTRSEIDNRDMPLQDALKEAVASGNGTVISCVPGQLAYFEFEDMGERYLLER